MPISSTYTSPPTHTLTHAHINQVPNQTLKCCQKLPCEQSLHFRCVSCRAKSSLCWQPFKSVQKSGRIDWKTWFLPVLDQFRALCESGVADQSCRNFFKSHKTCAIWRQTWWLILLANCMTHFMHARYNLNSCRQRLLFAHQLTQWKCTLYLQGSWKA